MRTPVINIPTVECTTRSALVERFGQFEPVIELAIGRRAGVARALAETTSVIATDRIDRATPSGIEFIRDDLTDPKPALYAPAAVMYALNLPEELHRPALELAETVNTPLALTTLGNESPIVPVERRETLPHETLFWART